MSVAPGPFQLPRGFQVRDRLRLYAMPTLGNVLVLWLIVVIRTALSFSLETGIEGVAPWRRALISGAGMIRRVSAGALESGTPGLIPDWQAGKVCPG
jgi:hypothetical protein